MNIRAVHCFFGILFLALLSSCATIESDPREAEEEFSVPEHGPTDVGDIVYTSEEGNIHTVDPATGTVTPITTQSERRGGRVYDFTQPMWSPDGTHVSYAGMFFPEHSRRQHYVYVNNIETGEIMVHESGVDQPPAYIQWSPDGSMLSYVRTSETGSTTELVVWNIETDESAVVLTGRPIYFDWSPDSSFIVAHGGASTFRGTGGQVYLANLNKDNENFEDSFTVRELPVNAGFFQTPVVNPIGDVFALSVEANDLANRIALFSSDGEKLEEVAPLSVAAAFAWSPNGERLAYLDGFVRQRSGMTGTLHVLDRDGSSPTARLRHIHASVNGREPRERNLTRRQNGVAARRQQVSTNSPQMPSVSTREISTTRPAARLVSEPGARLSNVGAFDWSPDGESIVYFQLNIPSADADPRERQKTVVGIVDSVTGDAKRLDPIIPTSAMQERYIPKFDQYNRSGTLWSPDSESFVLNARSEEDGGRPGIFVVDVSTMERRRVAYGYMPFWRPSP